MVLLIAEGPSFTFHLLSHSRRTARTVFNQQWRQHVAQTGAAKNPEDACTINYIDPIGINVLYRDGTAVQKCDR